MISSELVFKLYYDAIDAMRNYKPIDTIELHGDEVIIHEETESREAPIGELSGKAAD